MLQRSLCCAGILSACIAFFCVDARAEPQSLPPPLPEITYTYDALGRLVAVVYPDGDDSDSDPDEVAYVYDAAGNRISVTADGVETTSPVPSEPIAEVLSVDLVGTAPSEVNYTLNAGDPRAELVVLAQAQSSLPTQSKNNDIENATINVWFDDNDKLWVQQVPTRRGNGTPAPVSNYTAAILIARVGDHDLENGRRLVAGIEVDAQYVCSEQATNMSTCFDDQMNGSDSRFEYATPFGDGEHPTVLTHVQGEGSSTIPLFTRTAHSDEFGFHLGYQLGQQDGTAGYISPSPVRLGFVAISDDVTSISGNEVKTGGVSGVRSGGTDILFSNAFTANASLPLVFASLSSGIGPDPVVIRLRGVSSSKVNVHALEEQSGDSDIWHGPEDVSWLGFREQGLLYADGLQPAPSNDDDVAQVVLVEGVGTSPAIVPYTISIDESLDPADQLVVIAQAQSAPSTRQDETYDEFGDLVPFENSTINVWFAADGKLKVQQVPTLDENLNAVAVPELDVAVLIVRPGSHDLDQDGVHRIVAGFEEDPSYLCSADDECFRPDVNDPSASVLRFNNGEFSTAPYVISQVQGTAPTSMPLFVRQRYVDDDGIALGYQVSESYAEQYVDNAVTPPSARIGWVAFSGDVSGASGNEIRAGKLLFPEGGENHRARSVDRDVDLDDAFSPNGDVAPLIFGTFSGVIGSDPAIVRVRDATSSTFKLHLLEEQSDDPEIYHTPEDVTWVGFRHMGIINSVTP